MTASIPTVEPLEITAGDYVQWQKKLSDYLATDGWVLSYAFINASAKFSANSTASGSDHLITLAAATTGSYASGIYKWQSYVTNGSQRITIDGGEVVVKPNFATATTYDSRSDAKKTLDAIEAEILARAEGGMTVEYTIGDRSLKKSSVSELIVLRDKYRSIYLSEQNKEKMAKGLGRTNRILTRFL